MNFPKRSDVNRRAAWGFHAYHCLVIFSPDRIVTFLLTCDGRELYEELLFQVAVVIDREPRALEELRLALTECVVLVEQVLRELPVIGSRRLRVWNPFR